MTKVKCSVDSCQFWGEDYICTAGEIWVRNDITGDPDDFKNHVINVSQVEFGEDFNQKSGEYSKDDQEFYQPVPLTEQRAKTSPQTCCDTMKPKE